MGQGNQVILSIYLLQKRMFIPADRSEGKCQAVGLWKVEEGFELNRQAGIDHRE